MKTIPVIPILLTACLIFAGCAQKSNEQPSSTEEDNALSGGQSAVQDAESQKNVVQVAIASPDHSTLVQAIKSAELVDALSNAGPFTVFAPVNEAFEKLPQGTLENLLKPEQKEQLQDILEFHVAVGVYKMENIRDGQVLGMVNGKNITFSIENEKVSINGAPVLATVPASNGIVYVIDKVLIPE